MPDAKKKYIAPDGGWGWMVVLSHAISNLVMIPIMQTFGLIYKDSFIKLGITATEVSIIVNMNQAFGMLLSIINGPLLRIYGYRKVAILSALLYSFGVMFTSFATTFLEFILYYGIMASLGMSMALNSFSLAVNTYFNKKRNRALGLSVTIMGLGPILMPFLTSYLLSQYGSEGTMLIMGALSMNSLVGAFLLQPVKWHARRVTEGNDEQNTDQTEKLLPSKTPEDKIKVEVVDEEKASKTVADVNKVSSVEILPINGHDNNPRKRRRTLTTSSLDYEDCSANLYGIETPVNLENRSLRDIRDSSYDVNKSRSNLDLTLKKTQRSSSLTCSNLLPVKIEKSIDNGMISAPDEKTTENTSFLARQLKKISLFFGLELLRDPIYTNIMLGMSIAIFAELNFSVLTPFILADMQLTNDQIATMMSTLAAVDLVLRGLAPYIGEWLSKPPRIMYLISLALLISTRTPLIFISDYHTVVFLAALLGVAKGLRSVYMNLVIPSYVPLDKLAAATAIQYMANGMILLAAGPLLGVIRDVTGSYALSIVFINVVTAITIVMWLTEFAIQHAKTKRRNSGDDVSAEIQNLP